MKTALHVLLHTNQNTWLEFDTKISGSTIMVPDKLGLSLNVLSLTLGNTIIKSAMQILLYIAKFFIK